MVFWQVVKCTTSGFISGLGGILTLPVTLPANVTSVLYMQIRMIATTAYMCGFDVKDDRVKALVYAALCGTSMAEVVKAGGIKVGVKLTEKFIEKQITRECIIRINRAVGFRLMTKAGSTGIINCTKLAPIAGGVVGGLTDYATTRSIGNCAKKVFYYRSLKDI